MRKNQGFTLIELMIVIAIIAIIAAIAIPNMLQSRMRANEATALTCMNNYCTAQNTFNTGDNFRVVGNTTANTIYADNFQNLHFGLEKSGVGAAAGTYNASTIQLGLIGSHFASSRTAGTFQATPIVGAPALGITVYNGYTFSEPNELNAAAASLAFFQTDYALVANPVAAGRTGSLIYYVDSEGNPLTQPTVANEADTIGHARIASPVAGKMAVPPTLAGRAGWN